MVKKIPVEEAEVLYQLGIPIMYAHPDMANWTKWNDSNMTPQADADWCNSTGGAFVPFIWGVHVDA